MARWVATASYEACKYGIHSTMSSRIAKQRFPHLIFVKARFEVSKAVSQQMRDLVDRYTDLVQTRSLDEVLKGTEVNQTHRA